MRATQTVQRPHVRRCGGGGRAQLTHRSDGSAIEPTNAIYLMLKFEIQKSWNYVLTGWSAPPPAMLSSWFAVLMGSSFIVLAMGYQARPSNFSTPRRGLQDARSY